MSATPQILAQLQTQLTSHLPGVWIVGVSGGPDSLALLYALCESGIGAAVHVYHLDHGLRGDQSAADAEFVRQCATKLGIPHRIEKANLASEAAPYHNLNEAARVVRYRRLAQYASETDATAVLVAHTRDDQAETLLMRLLRGSGPTGLASMRPQLAWHQWAPPAMHGRAMLLRPLLECDRAETVAFCQDRQLTPRHDPSNDNPHNQRVRMRQHIVPALRHEQPQLNTILSRTALLCADDADFVAHQLAVAWPTFATQHDHTVTIQRSVFVTLHVALQRAAIRHAITRVHGSLRGWSLEHVEYVRQAIQHPPRRQQQLPNHVTLRVRTDHATIMLPHALASGPCIDTSHIIQPHGVINCRDEWWLLSTSAHATIHRNRWQVFLDPHRVYQLRTRQDGEQIGIGHGRHRRLQDVMVDARIPAAQRAHWPIVVTDQHVVWVPGARVDPHYVAPPDTPAMHLSLIHATDHENFRYDE